MFDDAKWKMLNDNWNAKKAATAKAAIANNQIAFSSENNSGRKQKSFLEDQISTGGSIGGALAGGAAGTAVLPGVGTLIGAVLGGALGGGGGQIVENAVTGEEDLTQDVGSEALWGGATSLPMGAYLKFAKAGGALVKGGGSAVAKNEAMNLINQAAVKTMPKRTLESAIQNSTFSPAMTDAVAKVAETPSLFQKLGGKLSGTADDLAVKQFRLTPTQLANYKTKFGEDAGQTIRKYGFANAEEVAQKGIDPLQAKFDETVKGIGAIPTQTIKANFDAEIAKIAKAAPSDRRAIGDSLKTEADNLLKRFGTDVDANELNAVRREFDSLVNYTQKAANPDRYGVNKMVADTLRKTLQNSDPTGSLKNTGRELQKLRQLSESVVIQDNLGRGSLPLNLTGLLGANVGGGVARGLPGAIGGAVITQGLNSAGGRKAIMGAIDKTAGKLSNNLPKPAGQTAKQAVIRMGGLGAIRSATNQSPSDLNTNPAINTTSTISAPTMNSNMDESYQQDMVSSSPFGISSEDLGQAMVRAMYAGDSKGFSQLKQMYEVTSDYEKSLQPKNKPMGVEAVKNMNNAAAGLTAINDLESMINQDSGVVSRAAVPDIAPLNGLLGTSRYRAAIKDAQDTLSRLRSGASMTEQESKRFDQMLPRVGDDPATIQYKINRFREYYNSFINNPAMAQPTPVSPVGM